MTDNREIVSGFTSADLKALTDQIYSRTDENHPQFSAEGNGFINILQNAKPELSATSVFVGKASL